MNWVRPLPGDRPGRARNVPYSARGIAAWDAYADVYYSMMYGFSDTRMPAPGDIDDAAYITWKAQMMDQAFRQTLWSGSGKPPEVSSDTPEHIWQYLYQRMLAARREQ